MQNVEKAYYPLIYLCLVSKFNKHIKTFISITAMPHKGWILLAQLVVHHVPKRDAAENDIAIIYHLNYYSNLKHKHKKMFK